MKNRFVIGRRELFAKLASAAGVLGLAAIVPSSATASNEGTVGDHPPSNSGSATVRVILATGTTVQWTAVTSGGLTVGGQTNLTAGGVGLNNNIVTGASAAIVAAGGPSCRRPRWFYLAARHRICPKG
jgi:hypothetical protein